MHSYSTKYICLNQAAPKHRRSRCNRIRICGFALAVLWVAGGCATKEHDAPAPEDKTSSCRSSVQGTSATATDLTSSGSTKPFTALQQSDQKVKAQETVKDQLIKGRFKYPSEQAKNSTPEAVTGGDALTSDTNQIPTQNRDDKANVSTSAQETSPQPLPQPPETIENYTVKGGENLYTIARQPFIYAEGMLWPLIYKANRDQIKDPRQIYPGQVLNIPRDISETDKEQARAKAKESTIFAPEGQLLQNPTEDK